MKTLSEVLPDELHWAKGFGEAWKVPIEGREPMTLGSVRELILTREMQHGMVKAICLTVATWQTMEVYDVATATSEAGLRLHSKLAAIIRRLHPDFDLLVAYSSTYHPVTDTSFVQAWNDHHSTTWDMVEKVVHTFDLEEEEA